MRGAIWSNVTLMVRLIVITLGVELSHTGRNPLKNVTLPEVH